MQWMMEAEKYLFQWAYRKREESVEAYSVPPLLLPLPLLAVAEFVPALIFLYLSSIYLSIYLFLFKNQSFSPSSLYILPFSPSFLQFLDTVGNKPKQWW